MNILNLPNVMLIQIFEFLPYEEVAKKRLICKKIDMICQHILNCGFNKVVKQHSISLKRIKALLPRRESERRNHCLARHADILTCIETRISMLSMTYSKYMDLNLCCFIPGRVLDEVFRILRLISKTSKPLRPHEVLQELRDISSMAIEHFDEKISHSLKKSFVDSNTMYPNSSSSAGSTTTATATGSSKSVCCDQMRQKVNILLGLHQTTFEPVHFSAQVQSKASPVAAIEQQPTTTHAEGGGQVCEEARSTMTYLKKMEQEYKKKFARMNIMLQVQTNQSRRLNQSLATIIELNAQVIELKKRLEDMDAKNRELSASIKQLNGDSSATNTPQTTATTSTTTVATTTAQEFSKSELSADITSQDTTTTTTSANPTDDDDDGDVDGDVDIEFKATTVKRHLDELPLEEENASSSTDLNTAKKSKIE
ncbi:F-box only protein 28 isoform X1 [Eupeodes corollae]|uniref:F-box only protein 28 isoform X1 n=1 Tax=Eupeodes corollae TaxID=290404 RepID=UPI0024908CE8|nr:F-box only protein 28 isoform X1 [Eupeodes corollae]